MEPSEFESILKAAFLACEQQFCPLSERQKNILRSTVRDRLAAAPDATDNPLDELSPSQREALLDFINSFEGDAQAWKIALLNDWLHDRDSGAVQFIREEFGFRWLNRLQPSHLQSYLAERSDGTTSLAIGDRIEVSNSLWEWVQGEDPDTGEWIACHVVGLSERADADSQYTLGTVRFANGQEYTIVGLYEWNRHKWRVPKD